LWMLFLWMLLMLLLPGQLLLQLFALLSPFDPIASLVF